MDAVTVGACIFGIVMLLSVANALLLPAKAGLRLALSACLGGLALFVLNTAGGRYGLHVTVNLVTASVVATLGVPGIALLVAYQLLLAA